MLQVGARAREAALSLASGASSLSPMVWRSSGSKVAPIAVDDYCNINRMSSLRVKKGGSSLKHFVDRECHQGQ